MKYSIGWLVVTITLCLQSEAVAQQECPLWPGGVPKDAIVHELAETVTNRDNDQNKDGLNRSFANVGEPTLTVYPASGNKPSPAVVIYPGGGYTHLAIDKEGHDVAQWLNTIGVAGIVVKYRTKPASVKGGFRQMPEAILDAIISDGIRAVRTARSRAGEWGIDSQKIGVMGFSAGGHLAVSVVLRADGGNPAASNPVDRVSSRPDFAALVYPAVPEFTESQITENMPPVFFANANDDRTTPADRCVSLYLAFRKVGVPAELHIYTKGGHGFGLGVHGGPVTSWTTRFEDWLRLLEIL